MERKEFIINCGKLALLATLTGCKKTFLDQENNSAAVQNSQYFTTTEQCETSTIVCYGFIDFNGGWWQTWNQKFLLGEAASDNAWISNTYQSTHATYDQVAQYTLNANNDRIESEWIELYKAIGIFNSTIEGVQGAKIDDTDKDKFIAELKFLR